MQSQHPSFTLLLGLFLIFWAADTTEAVCVSLQRLPAHFDGDFTHTTMIALFAIVLLVFQINFDPPGNK